MATLGIVSLLVAELENYGLILQKDIGFIS